MVLPELLFRFTVLEERFTELPLLSEDLRVVVLRFTELPLFEALSFTDLLVVVFRFTLLTRFELDLVTALSTDLPFLPKSFLLTLLFRTDTRLSFL